jgi:hypothetical protein
MQSTSKQIKGWPQCNLRSVGRCVFSFFSQEGEWELLEEEQKDMKVSRAEGNGSWWRPRKEMKIQKNE